LLCAQQSRFQTMSETIITKIDAMGSRIDELEHAVADLMDQVSVLHLCLAQCASAARAWCGATPFLSCLCASGVGLLVPVLTQAAADEEEEAAHRSTA
jgi:hypothetical protein